MLEPNEVPEAIGPASDRIFTLPNVISFLRLASVPVFVWLFVSGRENIAVGIYAAGALSDFFDGYLARRTDSVSELGKLLDPLADRIFIVALAVALVARQVLPLWLAVTIISRDLLLVSLFPLLDRRGIERIRVNFIGKSATAALLLGLTLLALSETDLPIAEGGRPAGMAVTLFGAVLYWVASFMYGRQARERLASIQRGGRPPGDGDARAENEGETA